MTEARTDLQTLYTALIKSKRRRLTTIWQEQRVDLDKGNAASSERLTITVGEDIEAADSMEELNAQTIVAFGLDLQYIPLNYWKEA